MSEVETDEDAESEMEDGNNTSTEEEYMSGSEGISSESEEDDAVRASTEEVLVAEALNLTSSLGIESAFAKVSDSSPI